MPACLLSHSALIALPWCEYLGGLGVNTPVVNGPSRAEGSTVGKFFYSSEMCSLIAAFHGPGSAVWHRSLICSQV